MRGPLLLACGCLPFALGRLDAGRDGLAEGVPCPLSAVTGVPCPFCGASRAFALAAHGDPGFLQQGAVWVLVALAAAVLGTVTTLRPGLALPRPRRPEAVAAAVAAAAWLWVLA